MREKCEFCNERVPKNKMELHLKNCVRARRAKKIEMSKDTSTQIVVKSKRETSKKKKKAASKTTEVLKSTVNITALKQDINEQQSSADQVTKSA